MGVWAACTGIQIPKQLDIQNARLGLLLRILQLLCVVFVVFNLASVGNDAWTEVREPVGLGISIWRNFPNNTGVVLPDYCTTAGLAGLAFSDGGWTYQPTECQQLARGESLMKMGDNMYFPTFIWDYYTTQSSNCGGCNAANQELESLDNGVCRCTTLKEFLARDVDRQQVVFNHGYKATIAPSMSGEVEFSGTSTVNGDPDGEPKQPPIRTHFKDSERAKKNGMTCTPGGKKEWLTSPNGISGTLQDFLECAGVRLDDTSTSQGVWSANDVIPGTTTTRHPALRLTGVKLKMTLTYLQAHSYDHDGIACEVTIEADEVWNSMNQMSYTTVPDATTNYGQYRYRYMYGVSIETEVMGSFNEFNYGKLVTFLTAQLVILQLPPQIVILIALLFVGELSKIYQTAATQKLLIKKKIAGFCTRMMSHTQSFKNITHQDQKIDFAMSRAEIDAMLQVVFNKAMSDGTLSHDEVAVITTTVMKHMDKSGEGSITAAEYLDACAGSEDVSVDSIAKLFDKDRKLGPGEKIFGNLRTEIMDGDDEGGASGNPAKVAPAQMDETPES